MPGVPQRTSVRPATSPNTRFLICIAAVKSRIAGASGSNADGSSARSMTAFPVFFQGLMRRISATAAWLWRNTLRASTSAPPIASVTSRLVGHCAR